MTSSARRAPMPVIVGDLLDGMFTEESVARRFTDETVQIVLPPSLVEECRRDWIEVDLDVGVQDLSDPTIEFATGRNLLRACAFDDGPTLPLEDVASRG
jgi:hypothetical protein